MDAGPARLGDARLHQRRTARRHFRYEWSDKGGVFYITGEFIALTPFHQIEHVECMFLPDPTPDC